jgi:hypothetical protein
MKQSVSANSSAARSFDKSVNRLYLSPTPADTIVMSRNQYRAIELGIVPPPARLPANMSELCSLEALSLMQAAPYASQAARIEHIAALITEALKGN